MTDHLPRAFSWPGAVLFHLLLAVLFLLARVPVPEPPLILADLVLYEAPPRTPPAPEPPAELPEPSTEPEEAAPAALAPPEVDLPRRTADLPPAAGRPGIRTYPEWVTGPPARPPVPIDLESRTRYLAGPLRRELASSAGPSMAEPSAMDTLLYVQQRLEELARDALAAARAAPKGSGWTDPIPQPGSIQELRGVPQIPVLGVAAAVAGLLIEEGKKVWNRMLGIDPDAPPEPDMDLTYEEVVAYAALEDRRGLSIFEWHSRLPGDFEGGLGDLQRIAARLAERRLARLEMEEQVFRYRRMIPRHEMVAYYTSFLNRLPPRDSDRRREITRMLVALVREPHY